MKKIVFVFVFLIVLLGFGVSAAMAYQTYLPMVNNQASPTPTVTPTPTPIPTVEPNPILLPNGDFEQGQVVWDEYSSYGYDIIRNIDTLPIPPHDGEWAAWLGGANNDDDSISQSVLVPADHPYISFWLWILSADACNNDFAYVRVNNNQIDKHDLCYDHNTYGWAQKFYDLSAYAGQTVFLEIQMDTNASYISSIFLDDFEFNVSQPK